MKTVLPAKYEICEFVEVKYLTLLYDLSKGIFAKSKRVEVGCIQIPPLIEKFVS